MHCRPAGVKRVKTYPGLVYRRASDSRNSGNLFVPAEGRSSRVLLLIHGGGWQALSRESIRGVAMELARTCGVAVWTPDYRLIGNAPWPACLDDVEAAARWVMAARELPLAPPPERTLAVGGFSAGAHLALMLGLTRLGTGAHCLLAGAPPTILGPDLYSHARDIFSEDFGNRFFGRPPHPEDWRAASPLAHVQPAHLSPLLLVHNVNDYLVPVLHSRAMAMRYRRKGGHCRTCFFGGRAPSHDIVNGRLANSLADRTLGPIVLKAIQAFLSDHFS